MSRPNCFGRACPMRPCAPCRSRRLLERVGADPRKLCGSVESLIRFAVKRRTLPVINNLVDAYNLVSLRTRCSLGAHDLHTITAPVQLMLLEKPADFTPLGQNDTCRGNAGEFAYVDGRGRLLCRLDVQQGNLSKVTDKTRRALLIIEATTDHEADQVDAAFTEAAELIPRFCGGRVQAIVGWEVGSACGGQ